MLLHKHSYTVNHNKNSMRPRPASMYCPADYCAKVKCLPNLKIILSIERIGISRLYSIVYNKIFEAHTLPEL